MSPPLVQLDILSDPVCPWCYLGKHNLDRAIEQAGGAPFVIAWHPFQLNPEMPQEGADRRAWLEAKFGSAAALDAAHARFGAMAAEAGLAFDIDAQARMPNTMDAHRLIHWAGIDGHQSAVVDALFRAYFAEGRDIGDPEVLADIADSAGMDGGLVARLLASDADRAEIAAREAHSRQMGVTAVPTYIVAQRHAVPGAQPVELWLRVIAELTETETGTGA